MKKVMILVVLLMGLAAHAIIQDNNAACEHQVDGVKLQTNTNPNKPQAKSTPAPIPAQKAGAKTTTQGR